MLVVGTLVALRRRVPPEERERRRRLAVHANGRMADGIILDQHGDILRYSYEVRGVTYVASQDVSSLREQVPEGADLLLDSAVIKYLRDNPANSIVVCEEWSGLRRRNRPAVPNLSEKGT